MTYQPQEQGPRPPYRLASKGSSMLQVIIKTDAYLAEKEVLQIDPKVLGLQVKLLRGRLNLAEGEVGCEAGVG